MCTRALEDGRCGNNLCNRADRSIERIDAICVYSGAIRTSINRLKDENKYGWATIFGRLIVGHLETHYDADDVGLIVCNPTHASREVRHTELILEAASLEDVFGEWPFDGKVPSVIKARPTTPSKGGSYGEKVEASRAVYHALEVPDPSRVAGQSVLVIDDLCTTGWQLDAVARKLRENGATAVSGLVLARAPYKPR